ncbi:hypothetical protein IT407_02860 [Candidatus Uhrbacteria bacterium]|nr:hypothetical protein [Candidatus Uhrbacteria bacterium]
MNKRDLLQKLASVRSTERGIVPDQAWVARTRETLLMQVRNSASTAPVRSQRQAKIAVQHFIPEKLMNLLRAPALAMSAVLMAVLGGSIASVNASERSVPGDFLYPIKIASEQTRLALVSDKSDKLKLKTEFVERRVQEIKSIATAVEKKPALLKEAAAGLKRDLDTVKQQLADVNKNELPADAAQAAKLVDQKTEAIVNELKQVKSEISSEAGSSLSEVEAAAVHTGVTAIEVLLQTKNNPDAQSVVSEADVLQSITNKVASLQNTLDITAQKLQSLSSSTTQSTSSSSVPEILMASTTLEQAKTLVSENKLDQVSDKLIEAAKTTAQAEASVNQLAASSTSAIVPIPEPVSETSTTPVVEVPSSTTATTTPP